MQKLVDRDVPGPKRDFIGYGRNIPTVVWPNGADLAPEFLHDRLKATLAARDAAE